MESRGGWSLELGSSELQSEMCLLQEYREWAKVSQQICSSFINKLGIPLAEAFSWLLDRFVAVEIGRKTKVDISMFDPFHPISGPFISLECLASSASSRGPTAGGGEELGTGHMGSGLSQEP